MTNVSKQKSTRVTWVSLYFVFAACRASNEPTPPETVMPPVSVATQIAQSQPEADPVKPSLPPRVGGLPSVLGDPPRVVLAPTKRAQLNSPAEVYQALQRAFEQEHTLELARLMLPSDPVGPITDVFLATLQRDFFEGTRKLFWQRIFKNADVQQLQFQNAGSLAKIPVDMGGAMGTLNLYFQRDVNGHWFLARTAP